VPKIGFRKIPKTFLQKNGVFSQTLTTEKSGFTWGKYKGNVEKILQRRSRLFAVLTYSEYAPRVKKAAALLDGLF
jgi:hypothetical protein